MRGYHMAQTSGGFGGQASRRPATCRIIWMLLAYRGWRGKAGELAHLGVDVGGRPCPCGNRGGPGPVAGRFYCEVACNDMVLPGQLLAVICDIFGTRLAEMRAPEAGRVVMIVTHNIVAGSEWVLSIGTPLGEP